MPLGLSCINVLSVLFRVLVSIALSSSTTAAVAVGYVIDAAIAGVITHKGGYSELMASIGSSRVNNISNMHAVSDEPYLHSAQ